MASNLPPNPSLDDIEDEIVFLETRIATLDPDSIDFASDEKLLQAELLVLQDMFDELQGGFVQPSPQGPTGQATPLHTNVAAELQGVVSTRNGLAWSDESNRQEALTPESDSTSFHSVPEYPNAFVTSPRNPLPHRNVRTEASGQIRQEPNGAMGGPGDIPRSAPSSSDESRKRPYEPDSDDVRSQLSKSQRARLGEIAAGSSKYPMISSTAPLLNSNARRNTELTQTARQRHAARMANAEAQASQARRDAELARQLSQSQLALPSRPQGDATGQAIFRPDGSYQNPRGNIKVERHSYSRPTASSHGGESTLAGPSAMQSYGANPAITYSAPRVGSNIDFTNGQPYAFNRANLPSKLHESSDIRADTQMPFSVKTEPGRSIDKHSRYISGHYNPTTVNSNPVHGIKRDPYALTPEHNSAVVSFGQESMDSDVEEISREVFERFTPRSQASQAGLYPHRSTPTSKGSFSAELMKNARAVVDAGKQSAYRTLNGIVYGRPEGLASDRRSQHGTLPKSSYNHVYFDDEDEDQYGVHARYSNVRGLSEQERKQQEIALAYNIQPDEDVPPEEREQTPEALKFGLYEHQKIALAWMKRMEESSSRGGILADDMGLGKTLEALSLMVARRSENPRCKSNLILAPVALLRQWESEIRTKLKPGRHQLTVWIHHGARKKRSFQDLRQFDVVVTTFGTLASEMNRLVLWRDRKLRDRDLPAPRDLTLIGEDCAWYRVIIDEAQCIRNKSTKTSGATCELNAQYRWCMTGTPMMNSLKDIYGLIRFLRIQPYNDWNYFRMALGVDERSGQSSYSNGMMKFQAMLRAILLRRTKQSKIDGKPIIQLPKRSIQRNEVKFGEDEKALYDALEQKSQLSINAYLEAGTVMKHYSNVLVLLLRLRQACCHPHLIRDIGETQNVEDIPEEKRIDYASQLSSDTVRRIIESTREGALECPICMDATTNPTILFPCGHAFCSEDFIKVTSQEAGIQQGDENGRAKCPLCRGPADASKAINFDIFQKVHQPDLWAIEHANDPDESESGDASDESETLSEAVEANEDDDDDDESDTESLGGFIIDDDAAIEFENSEAAPSKSLKPTGELSKSKGKSKMKFDDENDDDDIKKSASVASFLGAKSADKGKSKGDDKGKGKDKSKRKREKKAQKKVTLADLQRASLKNRKAREAFLRRLRKEYVPSAKITQCMALLEEIEQGDPTEKTIIFSQFTSMLDLVEIPVFDAGYKYERYTGSMSSNARADAVNNFMTKPDCRVMLVSLKAGNAGLNLTAASRIILLDPFWNPFVEEQAIDRAHRIGQMREVQVHRILVPGTIEDRILELQEQKRDVIGTALDESTGRNIGRLSVNQIRFLFGLGGSARS